MKTVQKVKEKNILLFHLLNWSFRLHLNDRTLGYYHKVQMLTNKRGLKTHTMTIKQRNLFFHSIVILALLLIWFLETRARFMTTKQFTWLLKLTWTFTLLSDVIIFLKSTIIQLFLFWDWNWAVDKCMWISSVDTGKSYSWPSNGEFWVNYNK